MNIRKIKGFCTAAKCGSFFKAADSIFMSQPAFSRMISSMEEELGCVLFERSRTETVLTDIGKQILPEMEQIVEHYERAAHIASVYTPVGEGNIIIGEFRFGWSDRSRELCAEWNSKNIGSPIKTQEVSGTSAFTSLRAGDIDFLHTMYAPTKFQPFLETVPAEPFRHCAYISVGHRFAGRDEISLSELKDEKFIFYERSQFPLMFERVTAACADEGFIPTVVFETDNTSMMMNRVGTGEGIAVIPNFCRPLRGVVAVPIKEMPYEPSYWFWWKENTRPEVQQFVQYLQEKTFVI